MSATWVLVLLTIAGPDAKDVTANRAGVFATKEICEDKGRRVEMVGSMFSGKPIKFYCIEGK